jgi:hypothetical protein
MTAYVQMLDERMRRRTESQRVQSEVAAVIGVDQPPRRATEREAVEAWSRSALSRIGNNEYRRRSKSETEDLPLASSSIAFRNKLQDSKQFANLQQTRDQEKKTWAPLTGALRFHEKAQHSAEAEAVSTLLASVKLRAMASNLSSGHPLVITEASADGLALSKMILFNHDTRLTASQPDDEERPSQGKMESALSRTRVDDPSLQERLIKSRMLREEASRL